jgi:hypothetical protein
MHSQMREEAVSLLDQAQVIYWIQSGKVQVQDEQRSVYCIVPQECSIQLSWPQTAWVSWQDIKKWMNNKKFIFTTIRSSRMSFEEPSSSWQETSSERWLHILKMNKLTVKYAAEFQWIAALMNWDDDALVLQYYWGLNETIKDEIVRMNWPEELQNMINIFININSCQWEQQMKRTEHYTSKMWKDIIFSEEVTLWTLTQLRSTVSSNHKWSKNSAWASSISLNLDEQRLTNVITVKSSNTLQEPARNLNKREKKLQQQIHT